MWNILFYSTRVHTVQQPHECSKSMWCVNVPATSIPSQCTALPRNCYFFEFLIIILLYSVCFTFRFTAVTQYLCLLCVQSVSGNTSSVSPAIGGRVTWYEVTTSTAAAWFVTTGYSDELHVRNNITTTETRTNASAKYSDFVHSTQQYYLL